MTKIRNYSGFRAINELDTTGTYLDRNRNKYAQAEYPKFRKMFGKVFKDAPNQANKNRFDIIDNFIKNFEKNKMVIR